ncbi:MAG: hypothetical protein LQ339_008553 [Xanthoria mediterranea]|nr:MAG: hypothetical protein LQ339_008553 [Xanthoria mediterranea]
MGRSDWSRKLADKKAPDKRARTDQANKRRKVDGGEGNLPVYATSFSKEEIEAEGRKPKKKVAVMLGYSGSGYKGMQLNHHEKTIEGDLFSAFVAAGAISKANADDPKKSSLVRCARTDRGVHAAGNVISLKMIIEDPAIVEKINEKLSSQIRVWGIERTNGGFSAYQLCDSRIYEYLIPTYCFLPPHPESFLGKELPKLAEEAKDLTGYQERQGEVSSFWKETEEKLVKPFLEGLGSELSESIRKALYDVEPSSIEIQPDTVSMSDVRNSEAKPAHTEVQPINPQVPCGPDLPNTAQSSDESDHQSPVSAPGSSTVRAGDSSGEAQKLKEGTGRAPSSPFESALKQLKHIIIARKKTYRIDSKRLARVQSVLNQYAGTHNFHNFTISKLSRDPSAKRVIKSFTVAPKPIIINETEWLSLKVHGQSFMMHQIRKMVTMAALIVRCGCPEERMNDSYGHEKLTVPKAPSLGLLLERPVFDSYNSKMRGDDVEGKGEVSFEKYEKEIEEFKQREIYERIFRDEDAQDTFHTFFASLDSVRGPNLLYLSSLGVTAARRQTAGGEIDTKSVEQIIPEVSDDEGEDANGQEG